MTKEPHRSDHRELAELSRLMRLASSPHPTKTENVEYDHVRDSWLRSEGYTVLRFWNNELMNEMEGVLELIRLTLSPSPSPANGRGEEA